MVLVWISLPQDEAAELHKPGISRCCMVSTRPATDSTLVATSSTTWDIDIMIRLFSMLANEFFIQILKSCLPGIRTLN